MIGPEEIAEMLLDAATAHGDAAGSEYEVGDLEALFVAAFLLLPPERRELFFAVPAVVETLRGDEYAAVREKLAGGADG